MGVPGLFAFLRRRYGVIAKYIIKKEDGTWDGTTPADALYVDMNHIIHSCTHANVGRDGAPYTEDAAFQRMDAYLTALLEVAGGGGGAEVASRIGTSGSAGPSCSSSSSPLAICSLRLLFVAIDGVAPIAKMNQQRTRRFLSAHVAEVTERVEREVLAEMSSQAGGGRVLPDTSVDLFDPNIISPGTVFMARVADRVRGILRSKVQNDPRFARLRVVVSDSYEPAEGEHKIMRFIRYLRTQPEYDPNTRHVIYGQDADLLLLSLLLHEPHVRVLREGNPDQQTNLAAAVASSKKQGHGQQPGRSARGRVDAGGIAATAGSTAPRVDSHASVAAAAVKPDPSFEEVDIGVLRECLQWEFAALCGAPDGRPLAAAYDGVEEEMEEEMEVVEEEMEAMEGQQGGGLEAMDGEEEEEEEAIEKEQQGGGEEVEGEVLERVAVDEVPSSEEGRVVRQPEQQSPRKQASPQPSQEQHQQQSCPDTVRAQATAAVAAVVIQPQSAEKLPHVPIWAAPPGSPTAMVGDVFITASRAPQFTGSTITTATESFTTTAAAAAVFPTSTDVAGSLTRSNGVILRSLPAALEEVPLAQRLPTQASPPLFASQRLLTATAAVQRPSPPLPLAPALAEAVASQSQPAALAISSPHQHLTFQGGEAAVVDSQVVVSSPRGDALSELAAPCTAKPSGAGGSSGGGAGSSCPLDSDEVDELLLLLTSPTQASGEAWTQPLSQTTADVAPPTPFVSATQVLPAVAAALPRGIPPGFPPPSQAPLASQVLAAPLLQQPWPSYADQQQQQLTEVAAGTSGFGSLPIPLVFQLQQEQCPRPQLSSELGLSDTTMTGNGVHISTVYDVQQTTATTVVTADPLPPPGFPPARQCRGWWPGPQNLDVTSALSCTRGGDDNGAAPRQQPSKQQPEGGGGRSGGSDSGGNARATTAVPTVAAVPEPRPNFDFEQILEDLVVLTFLAGNDFLPHVPSVDIYDQPSGLELLLAAYKELLPQMGGCITQGGGQVNTLRLSQLFKRMARDEEAAFLRRAEHRRRCQQRDRDAAAVNEGAFRNAANALLGPDGVSVGELPPGVDLDTVLSGLALSPDMAVTLGLDWALPTLNFATASEEELRAELARRVGKRTQERVMSGDPWAADPCGMGLPGYRNRYYTARFPDVNAGGDVDKIAALVVRSFMDGLSWVYRYYCLGPASLDFISKESGSKGKVAEVAGSSGSVACAGAPEGASWTWAYAYHYAPLMQDLASNHIQALAFRGSPKTKLAVPPVRMTRELCDMAYCSLDEWASPTGPVRPLLQLLCILPPKSATSALPAELASMLLIAHELDEEEEEREEEREHAGKEGDSGKGGRGRGRGRGGPRDHGGRLNQQPKHDGGRGRGRGRGRGGCEGGCIGGGASVSNTRFSVLLTSMGEEDSISTNTSEDDHTGHDDAGRRQGGLQKGGRFGLPVAPGTGGSWGLDGAGALSLPLLAKRVSRFFPNNIPALLDTSGKKYAHTAVVRLPVVQPTLLAHVVQEALRCGMMLSAAEVGRNRMLPSDLIVSDALYRDALAALNEGPVEEAGISSSNPDRQDPDASRVAWHLLLHPVPPVSRPMESTVPAAAVSSAPDLAAAEAISLSAPTGSVEAPVPLLSGPLGFLLAKRAGRVDRSAVTSSTLARAAAAATAPPVVVLTVDVAGLPVTSTRAAMLQAAQPSPLQVDRKCWRRIEAGASRGRTHAERVLGMRQGSAGGQPTQFRRGGGRMPAAQANANSIGLCHEYASYGGGSGGRGEERGRGGRSECGGRGGRMSGGGGRRGRGASGDLGDGSRFDQGWKSDRGGRSGGGAGCGRGDRNGTRGGGGGGYAERRNQYGERSSGAEGANVYGRDAGGYGRGRGQQQGPAYQQGSTRGGYNGCRS